MTEKQPQFILIDDDPINNVISKIVIKTIVPQADVVEFTEPEKGLEYIITTYGKSSTDKAILYLDLNMPTMTGWEFMNHFEQMVPFIKDNIKIFILSSSVDPSDREKAVIHPHVTDYLEKPLTDVLVKSVL